MVVRTPAARPVAASRGPAREDARPRQAGAAPGTARPRRWRLGDPRGLTAPGAVVLVLLVGMPALAVDLLLGPGPGALFGVAFVLGCALAALTVHPEDLRAAVVMPPLLYVGFAALAGALDGGAAAGGWLQQQLAQVAAALVYQAPVLWAATGAAAGVAVWRGLRRTA